MFRPTTSNPEAAKFVDQGFAQLHGFWYFVAVRSFRQAAALDEKCAAAYLGIKKPGHGSATGAPAAAAVSVIEER